MDLDFLGEQLFRPLAEEFGDRFFDGGLISMKELESAVRLEPEVAARHRDLGFRMLQDAKPEMARQALTSALRIDPNDAIARVGLACTFEAMNKTQTAIEELKSCLEDQPGHEPAAFALEYCSHKLGDAHVASESQYHAEEVVSVG